MKTEKLTMKYPPHGLYCPVCNNKAEREGYAVDEVNNRLTITKQCKECAATWEVLYQIIPTKIINLETKVIYEDIPLN
jgi:hypothetical protein